MDAKVRHRKSYTLKEKVDIIQLFGSGNTKVKIAKEKGMTLDSVKTILKNKDKILQQFENYNPSLKKTKVSKYQQIERTLYEWFTDQRSRNIPVNSAQVKGKALFFAEAIGMSDFMASNGWFEGFKKRFNLGLTPKICGEVATVPETEVNDWLVNTWPSIRAGFSPDDIFNADESAIFFDMLPDKIYKTSDDRNWGLKPDKQWITILVCANMSGSEKRKLLVIGNSKNPQIFHKNHSSLPVVYSSESRGWMNCRMWEDYLRAWDDELFKTNRKVLLLADNCSAHFAVPHLKQIKLEFFPPNATSVLQPCGQGIIKSLKCHYRRYLLERFLSSLESRGTFSNIDLIDAIHLASLAWIAVSEKTIANSFRRAKLTADCDFMELERDFDKENEALLGEVFSILEIHKEVDDTMESYVAIDNEIPVCDLQSDEHLISAAQLHEASLKEEDELEPIVEGQRDTLSTSVFFHIAAIKKWILQNELNDELYSHIFAIEKAALDKRILRRVQKNITDFYVAQQSN